MKNRVKAGCILLAVCLLVGSLSFPGQAQEPSQETVEETAEDTVTGDGSDSQGSETGQPEDTTDETGEDAGEDSDKDDQETQGDPQAEFIASYSKLKPTLKAKAENKKIRITFTGLSGSSYYVLQRSKSKTGGFVTIATIKAGGTKQYLDSKVVFGQTYYYRIRGVSEKYTLVHSAWSTVRQQRATLTAPVIYAADRMNETTLCVYWEPDKTADGYVIYRSSSPDGTYTRIGSVNNRYEYRFVVKNTGRNTRYYYKVRSYQKLNGKKIFSNLSESFFGELWKESVLYELFPTGVPKTRSGMNRYMTTITVPILTGSGQKSTMKLTVHKKLAAKIRCAFRDMQQAGIPVDKSCTGAFNYRYMTSGTLLSHHSYGCAIDINWTYNPYVSYQKLLAGYKRSSSRYTIRANCVAIWKKYGFEWGGNWKAYKDYMHFSYTGH